MISSFAILEKRCRTAQSYIVVHLQKKKKKVGINKRTNSMYMHMYIYS